eukprot:6456493-Amphidinium_carterae.2
MALAPLTLKSCAVVAGAKVILVRTALLGNQAGVAILNSLAELKVAVLGAQGSLLPQIAITDRKYELEEDVKKLQAPPKVVTSHVRSQGSQRVGVKTQSSVVIKIQWRKVLLQDKGHWVRHGQKVPALRSHLKEVCAIAETLLLDLWAPKDVAKNETVAYARVNGTSVGFVMRELTECRLVVTPPKTWQSATAVTSLPRSRLAEQCMRRLKACHLKRSSRTARYGGVKRAWSSVLGTMMQSPRGTFGIAVPHKHMDTVQAATGGPSGQRWVLRGTSKHWIKSEVEDLISMMQWNATVIAPLGSRP